MRSAAPASQAAPGRLQPLAAPRGAVRAPRHLLAAQPGSAMCAAAAAGALQAQPARCVLLRASKGGVLDDPVTMVPTPVKSTEGSKKKPPIYKVMLHNDNYNRREYVVKILLKTVEGLTVDDAVNVMQEAHETGVALVVACAQDQAEAYVETLRLNGLISTMEPGH